MPQYDPRSSRPTPAPNAPDEPAAVDALLDRTTDVTDSSAEIPERTIDLRESTAGSPTSSTPMPATPPGLSTGPSPALVAVVAGVVVGAGVVWVVRRRRRS